MTTVTIQLEGDALGFGMTWNRNVAQALFNLGASSASFSPVPEYQVAVTADTDEATIRRAARAASVALTQELETRWANERVSYHTLIDQALAQEN